MSRRDEETSRAAFKTSVEATGEASRDQREGAIAPHDRDARPSRYPRPTWGDWALLAISVTFVAMGLVILPGEPGVGIVTIAFFGTCAAVFVASMGQKYRLRRFQPACVEVIGGVPIRPRRGRFLILGGWLTALGAIMLLAGEAYPIVFRFVSAIIAIIGVGLFALTLIRGYPREFLRFDPDALTIARGRWSARIAWDTIVNLREGFLHDNPVLIIDVVDIDAIVVAPPDARQRLLTTLGWNSAMFGGTCFTIMPMTYGIDLPVLTSAIARYVLDAGARADLGKRHLHGAAEV